MKYVRTDRFGIVLEIMDAEYNYDTNQWVPPRPQGWIDEPWNSAGQIQIGDWARSNNWRPAGELEWADVVRQDRNAELVGTDWTQTGDQVPARAALWAPYRQALRDVPQQVGFATHDVEWPARPE